MRSKASNSVCHNQYRWPEFPTQVTSTLGCDGPESGRRGVLEASFMLRMQYYVVCTQRQHPIDLSLWHGHDGAVSNQSSRKMLQTASTSLPVCTWRVRRALILACGESSPMPLLMTHTLRLSQRRVPSPIHSVTTHRAQFGSWLYSVRGL